MMPTKNSLYIQSTEILPVIAHTKEQLKEGIRGLKKKVRELEEEPDKPRAKEKPATPANDEPNKMGDHDTASPHRDSAGTENPQYCPRKARVSLKPKAVYQLADILWWKRWNVKEQRQRAVRNVVLSLRLSSNTTDTHAWMEEKRRK